MKKLREQGILSERKPIIDLHGLGFHHHTVYLSLASKNEKTTRRLITSLINSPLVTWIFEVAGRYQYAISLTVRDISEVSSFFQFLSEELGEAIIDKAVITQLDFEYYGRRYLLTKKIKTPIIQFHLPTEHHELDQTDDKILDAMVNNEAQTASEISRHAKIPTATADRRRRSLEERGIIRDYFYWINASALGRLCYIVRIRSAGVPQGLKEKLFSFARKEDDVLYAIECFGPWDFEIGVDLESATQVSLFTQRIYDTFQSEVVSAEPVSVLQYLKVKTYPQSPDSN